ncbi:MAG: hypothetical protein AB1813_11990 [Verrucomicrobiota bacterium]
MKRVLVIVWSFVLSHFFFFAGCATPPEPDALAVIQTRFQQGHFESCLLDIGRIRATRPLEFEQQAQLWFIEALCQEALEQQAIADVIYHRLIDKFPSTTFSARAELRLARLEGDQLPSLVPEFDGRDWEIQARRCRGTQFLAQYRLKSESPREAIETVTVIAADIPSAEPDLERQLTQVRTEMEIGNSELKWNVLYRSDTDAVFYFQSLKGAPECGVGRLVLAGDREHRIFYIAKKRQLEPERLQQWSRILTRARISGAQWKQRTVRPELRAGQGAAPAQDEG